MASNDENVSNLLICPVCSETYKIPKMVSCGHSVCLDPCLQKLLQSNCPSCPVCNNQIESTSSGSAETFPTNFVLEALTKTRERNLTSSRTSVDSDKRHFKRKLCQLHEESLNKFCETCSELLCEQCVTEAHDQLHDTISVREASKKYSNKLKEIQEDLTTADERLGKVTEMLEESKLKCEGDFDSIVKEIRDAEACATQLLKNCVADLLSLIDERKVKIAKEIQSFESQKLGMLLNSNYLKNTCDSLKADVQSYSVTSKVVVENLSRNATKLLEDISQLEKAMFPDGLGLCFKSAVNSKESRVGSLESESGAFQVQHSSPLCKVWTRSEVSSMCTENMRGRYMGFAWINKSPNCRFVFIIGKEHYTNSSVQQNENCWYTDDVSDISLSTDITGLSLLGHSDNRVFKLSTCETSSQEPSIVMRTLRCEQENKITAVCWNESQTGCYALLKDGQTIMEVSSVELKNSSYGSAGKKVLTLDEPVVSITSRKFHVSELGRMAICETERKRLRYFESVQSKATKVVTAPLDIKGWYPVFVITRKRDQRWFVAWETLSYEIEEDGVPYARIYQYSDSFDLEGLRFKVACHKIKAFSFSEGNCDGKEVRTCGRFCKRENMQVAIETIPYQSTERMVSIYCIGD